MELLRRRGQCSEETFDALGLLQTLCLVKMDSVDGNKAATAARKQEQAKTSTTDSASSPTPTNTEAAKNCCDSPNSAKDSDGKTESEMKGERGHNKTKFIHLKFQ